MIVECTPQSAEVVSVFCSFCFHFEREEKPEAKHKATANVMYFKKPLRTDSYKQHLEDQYTDIASNTQDAGLSDVVYMNLFWMAS